MPHRTVVVLATGGVELLDLTGPLEVFSAATRLFGSTGGSRGYRTLVAGPERGPLLCSGGVQVVADLAWHELDQPIDTLVVAGSVQVRPDGVTAAVDPALVAWLRERVTLAPQVSGQHGGPVPVRRIASVCTGAHVLAAAGLLEGRRATTHWASAAALAAEHPELVVDADAVFVQDGPIWTSAGVSTGIDLSLALVAADHGERVARQLARWLVMYLKRPGGQSQFSTALTLDLARRPSIRRLQEWLPENLDGDLTVTALAERAGISPRHFARLFLAETGSTPAVYVTRLRVEAAVRRLIELDEPLPVTARGCGFGSVESLHRAFRSRLGVSPAAYRARFRSPAASV